MQRTVLKLKKRRKKSHIQLLKLKKNFENISILKRKDGKRKRVGEVKVKLLASSKILIEKDEKHLEEDNILLEQVADDNGDYENTQH